MWSMATELNGTENFLCVYAKKHMHRMSCFVSYSPQSYNMYMF